MNQPPQLPPALPRRRKFPFLDVAFLLLVAIIVFLIVKTPRLLESGKAWVERWIAEEQRVTAFEQEWQPPSAKPDSTWFPATVGERRLERSSPTTGMAEMSLNRAGYSATYRSAAGSVAIDVVPIAETEKSDLLEKARDSIGRRRIEDASLKVGGAEVSFSHGQNRISTGSGNRSHVTIDAVDHVRLWWVNGWLFIFRARGGADSEAFPEEFLRVIDKAAAAPSKESI